MLPHPGLDLLQQCRPLAVLQHHVEALLILKHTMQLQHVGVGAQRAHGGNLGGHGCGGMDVCLFGVAEQEGGGE